MMNFKTHAPERREGTTLQPPQQLGETITRRTPSWNCRDVTHEPSVQPVCSEERRRSA